MLGGQTLQCGEVCRITARIWDPGFRINGLGVPYGCEQLMHLLLRSTYDERTDLM